MNGPTHIPLLLLMVVLLPGCGPGPATAPSPAPGTPPAGQVGADQLVPPGYGTLVQDQITLRIQEGDLLIKVTPLAEEVIRLTAPDTYARLHGLAESHGSRASRGDPSQALFLVSFFSYAPVVRYEPEDLLLVNRGLRFRPRGIAPVTPSWGTQRLGQQETRMAIYAFDGPLELDRDLVVEYQSRRNEVWKDRMVPLLRAEEARVRARAGDSQGSGRRQSGTEGMTKPPERGPGLIPPTRIS